MIQIPIHFTAGGYAFRQIDRQGNVACYEKTKPGVTGFEVAIIRRCKARTWPDGRVTPAHESMPSSEQWGRFGWTYTDRESAFRRVGKLVTVPKDGRGCVP